MPNPWAGISSRQAVAISQAAGQKNQSLHQMIAAGQVYSGAYHARAASVFGGGDWVHEAIVTIEEESDHDDIMVSHGPQVTADAYMVTVYCGRCQKTWRRMWTTRMMLRAYAGDVLRDQIVPFLAEIMEASCWGLEQMQVLAEYVTARLVDAGQEGVAWDDLVRETREMVVSDGERVIRRLGFEETGSGLRLPVGHPLRTW